MTAALNCPCLQITPTHVSHKHVEEFIITSFSDRHFLMKIRLERIHKSGFYSQMNSKVQLERFPIIPNNTKNTHNEGLLENVEILKKKK